MPYAGRTFRIFVSSTFSDLVAERNALQTYVFPRLRELAMAHACRFQAIDLRWGVSEEAALDQQTMRICLGEIERCQRVTPRPNFIVLLGDRFGWRPLPYAIPVDEMERVRRHLSPEERRLILGSMPDRAPLRGIFSWLRRPESKDNGQGGWYRKDTNAVPPEYVLQPRQKQTRYEDYATWEREIELPLVAALERAARKAGLEEGALAKYTLSATGQEIALGAMKADAPEHVFGFFRTISNLEEAAGAVDGATFAEPEPGLRRRQQELKAGLRRRLGRNIHEYAARWQAGGLSTAHIGSLPATLEDCLKLSDADEEPTTLCEAVWLRLSRVILAEVGKIEAVDALEHERLAHHEFGRARARFFVGREESLARIAEYVSAGDTHPLAVWGESGCGKSALMAMAVAQARSRLPDAAIVERFIGATPPSGTLHGLLQGLCQEIYQQLDLAADRQRRLEGIEDAEQRRAVAEEYDIPSDTTRLARTLELFLSRTPPGRRLVIFLDALDQLASSEGAHSLAWLPAGLPPNVKVVLSTLPGEPLSALEGRLPASSMLRVPALGKPDGGRLLQLWLDGAGRMLTGEQQADILVKFEQGKGLPLYLKLAFEEAKLWHSYDGLPAQPGQEPGLGSDIPGIIRDLFRRLEQEGHHGRVLVSRSLGYLAAARNGLGEDELLDLLWQDPGLRGDFYRRSPKSPQEIPALPVVVWARLYMDLEPYLAYRRADGVELMGFYHRQLAEAAHADYLSRERHAHLASYFSLQPLYLEEGEATPNLRKLSEMVYQHARAGLAAQVEATLLDYPYLQAKLAGQGVEALIEDYALAPEAGMDREKAGVLSLVRDALRLSAHAIRSDPAQLAGQLSGRLLASNQPAVKRLLKQIRKEVKRPWLRPLAPCLTLPGGRLVRTLSGKHEGVADEVAAVAVTPDGRRAVSGWYDWLDITLKIVDLESGQVLRTLRGHERPITAVAVTPDGRRAVSASQDKMLKVWDLNSGAELRTLRGHTDQITAVAVTPDGRRIVSGSWDLTLKVWNVESGAELRTLRGDTGLVNAVAVTPDGRCVVSGSEDRKLKVWDLESGAELATLRGHDKAIRAVAVTPDGRLAVSGSEDKTLKVWDLESSSELSTLRGHGKAIRAVAVTRDGRLAVSGSDDKALKVWHLESGAELASLLGHGGPVKAVAVTPDGNWAVSGSRDDTLRVWDLSDLGHAQPASGVRCTLRGHDGPVTAVAASADGRRVVSASRDKTLKVWDLESGVELSSLRGHGAEVAAVALTSDGRRAVSGSSDTTVKVWDLRSGRELRTLRGPIGSVNAVALTPDGRRVVSASSRSLKVWDLETGALLGTLRGHLDQVNAVAVTPDGRRAVSGSRDETLRVWDLLSGLGADLEDAADLELRGHTAPVSAVAVTPDGRRAVSASQDKTLKVWDLDSGAELLTFDGHTAEVRAVAVAPDGRHVVSASDDKTLKVWDLESGAELASLRGHSLGVEAVALTPDGRRAVSGSSDKTLNVWDLASLLHERAEIHERAAREADRRSLPGHSDMVCSVAVTRDGRRAISASEDTTLKVWDLQTGRELRTLRGHGKAVGNFAATPDGHRVVSASDDKTLKVWDLESGAEQATLRGHTDSVVGVAVTPDGRRAVSASRDKTLKVWDLESGAELHTLHGYGSELGAWAITLDGRQVVSCSVGNALKVWDLESGVELHTTPVPDDDPSIMVLALPPDGRRAFSAECRGPTLRVWDMESGAVLAALEDDSMEANDVAVTPDGRRAVLAPLEDDTLKVWDLESGTVLATLRGHGSIVLTMKVTPDSHWAVSTATDMTLKVWDLESGAALATYTCDRDSIQSCAVGPDGRSIVAGDGSGGVHFLRLEGASPAPPVVTAWRAPGAGGPAFGCPHCRTWSAIPESAPGTELDCPSCGNPVRLTPSIIAGEWQPVAAAWRLSRARSGTPCPSGQSDQDP